MKRISEITVLEGTNVTTQSDVMTAEQVAAYLRLSIFTV
jgi:hypothetical protein